MPYRRCYAVPDREAVRRYAPGRDRQQGQQQRVQMRVHARHERGEEADALLLVPLACLPSGRQALLFI